MNFLGCVQLTWQSNIPKGTVSHCFIFVRIAGFLASLILSSFKRRRSVPFRICSCLQLFHFQHSSFFYFFILCFFSSVEFEEPWYYVYKAEMYRKEKSFDQALYQLQWLEILIFQCYRNNILTVILTTFLF